MRHRRLQLESLENRYALAGDVTANIVNGELIITGDDSHNWIEVRQIAGADGTGRAFLVEGKPFNGAFDGESEPSAGTAATRINGSTEVARLLSTKDNVKILMRAGNDVVRLGVSGNPFTANLLTINTQEGRDHVEVARTRMYGDVATMAISTGQLSEPYNQKMKLSDVVVPETSLTLSTGAGRDEIILDKVRVGQTTSINLGDWRDTLTMTNSCVFHIITVNAGQSNHRDVVTMTDSEADDMKVFLYAGNDLVHLVGNTRILERLSVSGGDGFDTLDAEDGVFVEFVSKGSVERANI